MKCKRCHGRVFLDRTFSDTSTYELSCVHCGDRKFLTKGTELSEWLETMEEKRQRALDGLN